MDPAKWLTFARIAGNHLPVRVLVDGDKLPYALYDQLKPAINEAQVWSKILGSLDMTKPQTWIDVSLKIVNRVMDTDPPEEEEPQITDPVVIWMTEHSMVPFERGTSVQSLVHLVLERVTFEWFLQDESEEKAPLKASLHGDHAVYALVDVKSWKLKGHTKKNTSLLCPSSTRKKHAFERILADFIFQTDSVLSIDYDSEYTEGRNLKIGPDDLGGVDYVGTLLELEEELRTFWEKGVQRKILIQGPPGSGKTTLNKTLGRRLSNRVVYMTNKALAEINGAVWEHLIYVLNPEVLIIDDIDYIDKDLKWLLNRFEENFYHVPITLLTSNFHSNMPPAFKRPGRIDRIYDMKAPNDARKRRQVIALAEQVGAEDIPEEKLDLLVQIYDDKKTGAYIKELIRTGHVLGWDTPIRDEDLTYQDIDDALKEQWNSSCLTFRDIEEEE